MRERACPGLRGIGRTSRALWPPWAAVLALLLGCQQPRGDVVERLLIGEVMMHAELAANLRALAMPGGRLSGTPNAERAEDFVAGKLRAYGWQNVHFEPFDMNCWTVHETVVTLLTDPPQTLEGAIALARTEATPPGGLTARLVDAGEGGEADFAALAGGLKGAFALIREKGWTRREKIRRALDHDAAGVVFMAAPDHEPHIGGGHATPRPEPIVAIRHDAELLSSLAGGAAVRVNIQLATENWSCRPRNVIAELPGRGGLANEIVIVCAHLDSWHLGEGAIDNGNGSAAILETARALAAVAWRPHRTVRFIWFMGEELGLAGSEAYVRAHAGELDRIVAVVNVDMPGSPRAFGQFGHPELVPFLEGLRVDLAGYEIADEIGAWSGDGSDHAPFVERGVAALSLGGDIGPGGKFYHLAGDTYDVVDRRATIQSSAVLAVLVRRLADLPERPTVHKPPASQPASNG